MDYSKFRLRSFTRLPTKYSLRCGSYHELPIKYYAYNPTDKDTIGYYYDICAIPWNRNPPKNTKCTVFRIDSKQTPPGFARLMVDQDNTGDNPTYFRRPPFLRGIETGGPSRLFEIRQTQDCREFLNINRDQYQQIDQNTISYDVVPAVYCPYWPVEAEEWRKRKRFNGWPNEKLIARITRGGCHFVSKLRTWSTCDDTEWRFSFSKAELLLIHSWTPDQKLTYHTVRVVKRRISEYCGGDGNKAWKTYYFKTLMFWAYEEFPPEFWGKQNINTCVETLLLRFLICLKEKLCPSYFIPECNIMSHLKNEGSFDNELQTLQTFLRNGMSIFAEVIAPKFCEIVPTRPYEYNFLNMLSDSFPLSKELNGRFAQYLSECEWFLPGIRNLHVAIEAHLRLMSVESVTQRQTSKDYVICVEHFDFAFFNSEEFESYERINSDQSFLENLIRMIIRKLLRNPVPVYRRMSFKHVSHHKMIKRSHPPPLQCVTSAYRANFYFTAMQSYKEALIECEKCFEVLHNKAEIGAVRHSPREFGSLLPLLMCNRLSQIYDEHLQVILGFATLHRNISFSKSPIVIATSHEVCLKLDSWEFLKYLYIQCEQKLYSISVLAYGCYSVHSDLFQPYASQLMLDVQYSAAILFAALRQSRVYKNSLSGFFIPDHFLHYQMALGKLDPSINSNRIIPIL